MSATTVNAATDPSGNTVGAAAPDGDALLSLLDSLRRDGFPIGVKEYIVAQQVAIACSDNTGVDPMRLRNWLAPILCTNPDEQHLFYRRFDDWWAQQQPEPDRLEPQPVKTELDEDIQRMRPWKWVALAAALMAAAVVVPRLLMEPDVVTPLLKPAEPGPSLPTEPGPPEPVEPEPIGPQLLVDGRVTDLEGREIDGATVLVVREMKGRPETVMSNSFSPDSTRLVTVLADGTARIWDAGNGLELVQLQPDGSEFRSAEFSPDGTRVLTVDNNTARIWDAGDGLELVQLRPDGSEFRSAEFSPDGTRVLTVDNKSARIWDAGDGRELVQLRPDGSEFRSAEFSPDGTRVLTVDNKSARIWDAGNGLELVQLRPDGSEFRSAEFSPDGMRVLTKVSDSAYIFDAESGRELAQLQADGSEFRSTKFSPDGARIGSLLYDGTVRFWDASDGRELGRLPYDGRITSAEFSPDGTRVLTVSDDNTARIWIAGNGPELARLTQGKPIRFAAFSPDGRLIAISGNTGSQLLHSANSDNTGNFNLTSNLTGDTQLQVYHPDYQDAPLHDIPDGYGKLIVEARLAPRPAQWLATFIQNRDLTRATLTLLPLLAVTAWLLWRRKRRQLILQRRTVRNIDALAGVAIPEPEHTLYRDESFVRARIEARRHQVSGAGDLDADATVDATVRQLGWFTPVYKTRLRLPAYLALIDRSGFRDQQTSLVDEFLDRLEDDGVTVDRYYFDSDPRMCITSFRGETTQRALRELAGRHPEHRLLLFSDGGGLLDAVTGRLAAWTSLIAAWRERVLMTPVPAVHWSSRELELAATGCSVLPATPTGLLVFIEQLEESDSVALPQSPYWRAPFPDIISAHPARWLQRDEPRLEDIDELLRQLRRYLGDDSYRWLCALTVYPELDWHLTLYLGLYLKRDNGAPVLDETALLDLVRLPWLRRGNLPDWLRLRLIAELSGDDENTVRGFLRDLLRARLEASSSRFKLDIAHPSENIQRHGWTRFFSDLLRTEPGDSPLQDRVFVNFLLGKRPQRLQVLAPPNWHRWVYERGLSALGLRDRTGLLLAAVASVLLSIGTFPLIDYVSAMQAGGSESQITQSDWQPAEPGPAIELIEPVVTETRGFIGLIPVEHGINEKVIVGRVHALAGLLTLTVNDQDTSIETNGLFRAKIPVHESGSEVAIVAVDKAGQRAVRRLRIKPAESALPPADFGNYHALVIGNQNYKFLPNLPTAGYDAKAVAEILRTKFGFKVTTLLDANRYQILVKLNQLRETLTEDDNLLIYYAGHSELDEVNDRGHWLPIDAGPNDVANWISNETIVDILNIMPARHIIVVADAAFPGTWTRSVSTQLSAGQTDEPRSKFIREPRSNYIRTVLKKRSRTALTSGGLAPVLDAGREGHSVFANAFIDSLTSSEETVLEGQRLFLEVVARVTQAAYDRQFEQVPQYAPIRLTRHEAGDFFFVPAGE